MAFAATDQKGQLVFPGYIVVGITPNGRKQRKLGKYDKTREITRRLRHMAWRQAKWEASENRRRRNEEAAREVIASQRGRFR